MLQTKKTDMIAFISVLYSIFSYLNDVGDKREAWKKHMPGSEGGFVRAIMCNNLLMSLLFRISILWYHFFS